MDRRRLIQPTLAAAAAAVALLAPAIGQAASVRTEFDAMDTDKDGFLTVTEYQAPQEGAMPDPANWRRRNVGPDGIAMYAPDGTPLRLRLARPNETLEAKEGEVVLTSDQLRQYSLNRLEVDGDQKLSFEEYRVVRIRGARYRFDRADTDMNDRITEEEYLAAATFLPSPESYAKYTDAMKANHETGLKKTQDRARARFAVLDLNQDKILTRSEMVPS